MEHGQRFHVYPFLRTGSGVYVEGPTGSQTCFGRTYETGLNACMAWAFHRLESSYLIC